MNRGELTGVLDRTCKPTKVTRPQQHTLFSHPNHCAVSSAKTAAQALRKQSAQPGGMESHAVTPAPSGAPPQAGRKKVG